MSQEEPARVFEVSCSCGYSEKFRHRDDADVVFRAHSTNYEDKRCGRASLDSMHAYPEGGVDPEETLPYDVENDPDGLTEPEVFHDG